MVERLDTFIIPNTSKSLPESISADLSVCPSQFIQVTCPNFENILIEFGTEIYFGLGTNVTENSSDRTIYSTTFHRTPQDDEEYLVLDERQRL